MEGLKARPKTFLMPLVFFEFFNVPKPKDIPPNPLVNQLIINISMKIFVSIQTATFLDNYRYPTKTIQFNYTETASQCCVSSESWLKMTLRIKQSLTLIRTS